MYADIYLALISLGLIGVIYYLLTRRRLSFKKGAINELQLGDSINFINDNINEYKHSTEVKIAELTEQIKGNISSNELMIKRLAGGLSDNLSSIHKELVEIKNHLSALQEYNLEKEKKIRRFEEGYDYKIQNEFIRDIFATLDNLQKRYFINKNEEVLEAIEDILLMLENNNILKIDIKNDIPFVGNEKIARIEKVENTDDVSKDGLIKEINRLGFYLQTSQDTQKIIRPSSVTIYKLSGGDK
jgi:molecular chaperone GrpE (heat shock protein)